MLLPKVPRVRGTSDASVRVLTVQCIRASTYGLQALYGAGSCEGRFVVLKSAVAQRAKQAMACDFGVAASLNFMQTQRERRVRRFISQ